MLCGLHNQHILLLSKIYNLRLDGLDETALEKFHNRENKNLTISEQFAIEMNDIERLQKLWREEL